jgi:hypothetical protein
LPSDESVPAAASPSWATLLAGNTLFWLAYSLASTATRVPSISAPLAGWLQAWVRTTPQWVTGLLFTPLVVVMARRVPLNGTAWKRNAAAHTLGAVGLTLGGLALQQGLYFALHPAYAARITWWASYTSVVADMVLLCLMLYAGGVGIYHAWAASMRLNQAEAQCTALAQQLDATDGPHANGAPPTPAEPGPDRILVTARDALVPVPVEAIRWIEAADAYVKLHTADGAHLHRARLKTIAAQLAPKGFVRIHRSTVIRLDALDHFDVSVVRRFPQDGRPIVEIAYQPKPSMETAAAHGRLFIDTKTHALRRFTATVEPHPTFNPVRPPRGTRIEQVRMTLAGTMRRIENGTTVLDQLTIDLQYIHHKDDHFRRQMQTQSVFFFYDFDDVAGISATPVTARQDDYARIDAAAYDPAFWRDHPVLARTPTNRAAIASFERTGAFGRLTDMLE